MRLQNYFQRFTILTLFLFILASLNFAQSSNFTEPREETLLNNLKVLIWKQRNTGKVTIKVRVHSGSAFDAKGKMGTMVLLGDILFPEEGIKAFFKEDLNGSLEIVNTYDYIQINATGNANEFVTMLETLAPAISNPDIDKAKTAKVKAEHLAKLKELEKNPTYIADRAIAQRLLGDFPYGRPLNGTTESVNKIDFADLIFAEQRFFNADNATLAIVGDVDMDFAYKAARRLFGAWKKGDKKVPATFRIPDDPDEAPLVINVDEKNVIENRYALNATSRRNKDYFAIEILSEVLNKRFKETSKEKGLENAWVKNNAKLLRGFITFAKKYNTSEASNIESTNNSRSSKFIAKLFTKKISSTEFNQAKKAVMDKIYKKNLANLYFDLDTYKLDSLKGEMKKLEKVNIKDVENIAMKLSKRKIADVSVASIANEKIPEDRIKEDPKDPQK